MKQIIATINPKTGEVTIKATGYSGASCLEATKKLEQGLGLDLDATELTPEFFSEETKATQVNLE